jgi:peptidoglycan/LPS O-acetylase OafA/YrhL
MDKPKAHSGRIAAIDGYRGIGAILVVVVHVFFVDQLVLGLTGSRILLTSYDVLPLFFVLSGMLTYRAIINAALRNKQVSVVGLLSNRLWRILPVYYTIVIVVWAYRFAGTSRDWKDLILHLSFMQTWSSHYVFWLDGPSWFLSDDMQFFFLIALLAPLLIRWIGGHGGLVHKLLKLSVLPLLMLTICCVYIGLINKSAGSNSGSLWLLFNPLYTAGEFSIGMFLAIVLTIPGWKTIRPKMGNLLTFLGFVLIVLLGDLRYDSQVISLWYYEFVSIAVCFLIGGATIMETRQVMAKVLSWQPLQFIAVIGLTILLVQEPVLIQLEQWHIIVVQNPITYVFSAAAGVAVSILLAWILLKCIEIPSLALRNLVADVRKENRGRILLGIPISHFPVGTIEHRNGVATAVNDYWGSKPLLVGFGKEGLAAFEEQRFRLTMGEVQALHIVEEFDDSSRDAENLGIVAVQKPSGELAKLLHHHIALLEVDNSGAITALQPTGRIGFSI